MTDVAAKPTDADPSVENASAGPTAGASAGDGGAGGPAYAWAPVEPRPRRRRTGLWIGIGAGVAAIGAAVVASLVLIAPGTTVAGVDVGFLTPGAATDAIAQRLAETTVVLTGADGETEVTGAALGAAVDAGALADSAFAAHPMWNPASWFAAPIDATVQLDAARADGALADAMPTVYEAPVDAGLSFDAATAAYTVVPAEAGTGIDPEAVRTALQDAFDAGERRTVIDVAPVGVEAAITTAAAEQSAAALNGMLDQVGFYVGQERTVPVDRAVAASWLTVSPDESAGTFTITADPAAIQPVVDTLAGAVNRTAVDGTVITNSAGEVLREETAGVSGRELGDISQVPEDFAAQLSTGDAVFELPVTEVPPVIASVVRTIEVDLTNQRTTLYENGNVVQSWLISSGRAGTETSTGRFTIGWQTPMQDLGCGPGISWCQPDVPWVTYFNGDEAFHGTYWHNNFGTPMSHGCVNMTIEAAKFLYDWAPQGTEVWVHT